MLIWDWMPRARSPKIVFRKPLERSNPHQCPETPGKSEGDRDTQITVVLYPRKYLTPKPFKTHFYLPCSAGRCEHRIPAHLQHPVTRRCEPPAPRCSVQLSSSSAQPHSFPNSTSDLGCVYKAGSREDRDAAAAGMAGLQNVQKRPEARHCPPAPSPINSNKLFIAQQKKKCCPSPPSQASQCVLQAQAPSDPPSCPRRGAGFIPRER